MARGIGKCDNKVKTSFVVTFSLKKNVMTSQNVEVAETSGSLAHFKMIMVL